MTTYQNTSPARTLIALAFTLVTGSVLMLGALAPANIQTAPIQVVQIFATVSAA